MAELRVGIDVSPLELTGAGTARYLRNLLDRLAGVEVRRYSMPGSSRARKVVGTPPGTSDGFRAGLRATASTFSTAPATGDRSAPACPSSSRSTTWPCSGTLNAFADAVHAVHRDNVVITGGLAPFTTPTGVGPLPFMRVMLCMSKKLKPTCRSRSRFDVWAHHPYTSGGPNHHANLPDDVSLGDLPEMRRLLDAAVRAGHVESRQPIRFWVTEFGWDTRPPDPKGVPSRLHARWVAEALYRMWSVGVSLVTWNQLRDAPFPGSPFQSGLYFLGRTADRDRPKPALRAFRFPFVALPEKGRVVTWGRTPKSTRGRVVLERRFGRGRWKRLAALQPDRHGIFQRTWKLRPGGYMRARLATGELSLSFAVKKTRDRRVCVFGTLPNCNA